MAGSTVVTTREITNNIIRYTATWTSDASGNVSGTTFDAQVGTIIMVEFHPGTGGSQPTDLYDVDLLDEHGVSVFDDGAGTSVGSNLSNVLVTHRLPVIGQTAITMFRRWHQGGPLQLTVANAGDSNSGEVDVYIVSGVL